MRQKSPSEPPETVEILSKTKAIMVLIVNRTLKSYSRDDTVKLGLAAIRAQTSDAAQKKAGFWTRKSLAAATDAELTALGLQKIPK